MADSRHLFEKPDEKIVVCLPPAGATTPPQSKTTTWATPPFTPPAKAATLFPKISGHPLDVAKSMLHHLVIDKPPHNFKNWTIPMTGTVKLHGSHADIVIRNSNEITLQSRTQAKLTVENDVHGFASWMSQQKVHVLKLKERIIKRFEETYTDRGAGDYPCPVIIAGEWIGPGVQNEPVAINFLPFRIFVITCISINDEWQNDTVFANIDSKRARIFNVSKGGFFHGNLDISRTRTVEESTKKLQVITNEVERECPFGKAFGISGGGEGIVWKPAYPLSTRACFWLKMKGPIHTITTTDALMVFSDRDIRNAKHFARACVTERRLNQAWEYLGDARISRNKAATGRFMEWVVKDIEMEEGQTAERLGVSMMRVRKEAGEMAKLWYRSKVEEMERH